MVEIACFVEVEVSKETMRLIVDGVPQVISKTAQA
jgi:hypothetical protein